MKIAKNSKTILCDDVRHEVGGKMSLMGLYSQDIVVNKVPAILPSISLVIMFEDIKETFKKIYVTLIMPKSEPIKVSYSAPADIAKGKDANIVLSLSPFKLNNTGKAKFELRFSEDEKAALVHHFLIKTNEQG